MASINGISIKSLKKFKDHEGVDIYQGNVYYKNKKLGFWSQDAWCGCDNYDFDTSALAGEVERYMQSDMVEDKYREITDLDILLANLVVLMDDEKMYKKGVKEGYGTLVVADDGCHMRAYATTQGKDEVRGSKSFEEFIADCRKGFWKDWDGKVKVYGSLDDFNLTV